jgi:hypothetical protein
MWQTKTESESEKIIKISIAKDGSRLRFSDVITLWRDSFEFRRYFSEQLSSVPFTAFRWETPPVTVASIDRDFECVIIESPGLARTPDMTAFSDYFQSHAVEDVAVFPNLGNDAMMVVPCLIADNSAYGHLAAFLRKGPEIQQHSLWKLTGEAIANRLSSKPIWLNTAGAGVSWLHVRLDSRPKYYSYLPYKRLSV